MASNPPKYTRSQYGNPEIVKSEEIANEEEGSPAYAFKQAVAIHSALQHIVDKRDYFFNTDSSYKRAPRVLAGFSEQDKFHAENLQKYNALEKFENLMFDTKFIVMFMKRTI